MLLTGVLQSKIGGIPGEGRMKLDIFLGEFYFAQAKSALLTLNSSQPITLNLEKFEWTRQPVTTLYHCSLNKNKLLL